MSGAAGNETAANETVRPRPTKRVRTPTVLQMESVECGAAALAIVLAHYKKWVLLEELRTACGVSRDGSKASNIVKAARTYGLLAKGYKKEPQDLPLLPMPCIVFWNFNHFVVVEGFSKKRVYLNDPAMGPRSVTIEEFDESFTGVVLVFEKDTAFQPSGAAPSGWRGLIQRLPGSRLAIFFLGLCTFSMVIPGMVSPVLSQVFLDKILVGGMQDWLRPLLAIMAATAALGMVFGYLQADVLLRLQTRLGLGSTSRFVWHIFHLPMEFFSQRYAGDVASRIGDNQHIASLLSSGISSNVVNLVMVFFFAFLLIRYDLWLTLIGVSIALLNLGLLQWSSRSRADDNRRVMQEQGKCSAIATSGLWMIETIKASGNEDGLFSRWAGSQAKVLNSGNELGVSSLWLSTAPTLLGAVNGAAILALGGTRVMDGALTMGMFIAFQQLMGSFMGPVNSLLGLASSLQTIQGTLARLDDVLKYPVDPAASASQGDGPEAFERLEGEIELRNVAFGYSRLESPLIQNFSLKVKPGRRVALVGGSGSGKSTVAKIVAGLYQPWSGTVLFDGKPRNEIPRSVIHHSIAFVDQDFALFQGTVRENLTIWDSTVEDQDVVAAGKDACIHDDLNNRPGGYDQPLDEGGRNLSGGQRQRLEIARALTNNPRILILDEATSALDPVTERMVDDHLRRRGCTLLIVAHRLSTIRDCDEIVVMRSGRIVQRGTHEEMIHVPGPYADLIDAG